MKITQIYVVYNIVAPRIFVAFDDIQGIGVGNVTEEIGFDELGSYINQFQGQIARDGKFMHFDKGVYTYNNRQYPAIVIDESDSPQPVTQRGNIIVINDSTLDLTIDTVNGLPPTTGVPLQDAGYSTALPLLRGQAMKWTCSEPTNGVVQMDVTNNEVGIQDVQLLVLGTIGNRYILTPINPGANSLSAPYSFNPGETLVIVVTMPPADPAPPVAGGRLNSSVGVIGSNTGITGVTVDAVPVVKDAGDAFPLQPGQFNSGAVVAGFPVTIVVSIFGNDPLFSLVTLTDSSMTPVSQPFTGAGNYTFLNCVVDTSVPVNVSLN